MMEWNIWILVSENLYLHPIPVFFAFVSSIDDIGEWILTEARKEPKAPRT
jgi:hypothetical protein